MAEWVQTELASWGISATRNVATGEVTGIKNDSDTYVDLSGTWTNDSAIEHENIYYVPFEENKDSQIKAHKFFPLDPNYVKYEVDEASTPLGSREGDFIEIKLGFFESN